MGGDSLSKLFCDSLFSQEGDGTDQAQSRPNPPQFVQGIISMLILLIIVNLNCLIVCHLNAEELEI